MLKIGKSCKKEYGSIIDTMVKISFPNRPLINNRGRNMYLICQVMSKSIDKKIMRGEMAISPLSTMIMRGEMIISPLMMSKVIKNYFAI